VSSTVPSVPRKTSPAVAGDDEPSELTATVKSSVSPGTTATGALVQVGDEVAALPPEPVADAPFEPSVPESLQDVVPPAPLEPLQPLEALPQRRHFLGQPAADEFLPAVLVGGGCRRVALIWSHHGPASLAQGVQTG